MPRAVRKAFYAWDNPNPSGPALLVFSKNWIEGVRRLTVADRAVYNDLLHLMSMADGPIENAPPAIADVTGISARTIKASISRLIEFGKITLSDDDMLSNGRCFSEIKKRRAFSEKQAENGRKGGRPKGVGCSSERSSERSPEQFEGKPRVFEQPGHDIEISEETAKAHVPKSDFAESQGKRVNSKKVRDSSLRSESLAVLRENFCELWNHAAAALEAKHGRRVWPTVAKVPSPSTKLGKRSLGLIDRFLETPVDDEGRPADDADPGAEIYTGIEGARRMLRRMARSPDLTGRGNEKTYEQMQKTWRWILSSGFDRFMSGMYYPATSQPMSSGVRPRASYDRRQNFEETIAEFIGGGESGCIDVTPKHRALAAE